MKASSKEAFIGFRCSPERKTQAEQEARRRGTSLSALMRRQVENLSSRDDKGEPGAHLDLFAPTALPSGATPSSKKPTSSSEETTGEEVEVIAEALFGGPVSALDAYDFGRSFGRRARLLFADKMMHVLRGMRVGINEIGESEGDRRG